MYIYFGVFYSKLNIVKPWNISWNFYSQQSKVQNTVYNVIQNCIWNLFNIIMQNATNNKAGQFQFWVHHKPGVGNYSQPMQPPRKGVLFLHSNTASNVQRSKLALLRKGRQNTSFWALFFFIICFYLVAPHTTTIRPWRVTRDGCGVW